MNSQTEYIHKKTMHFPGMVARIYCPVLTEEERQRRYKAIYKATANLLKEEVSKK